ncbi:MAG: transposase, partial [Gammaproteobacteria bacterium]
LPCTRRYTPQQSRSAAEAKVADIVGKLSDMKLSTTAEFVENAIHETLTFFAYPPYHWLKLKSNNPMARLLKDARR